jgi:uncharacterized phage-like protein YoqJ
MTSREIVAATGHRPDKLGGFDADPEPLVRLVASYLLKLSPDEAITGMALGFDQAFGWACYRIGIPFIAAVPCDGQESRWQPKQRQAYRVLLKLARRVEVVSLGPFSAWKMHRRNEWMVDQSTRICALYNGDQSGGTFGCIEYAEKRARPIDNLWPLWMEARS